MSVVTVTQLNRFIRLSLEGEPKLKGLFVRGEISNLSDRSLNGHLYFSLKDEGGVVRCVMFSSRARDLRFRPEEGMRVLAGGDVTVYEKGGQYQLNVFDLAPDGVGALYAAFEERKRKLNDLGLFDASHKRPLPPFPTKLGLVAAPGSAAMADFLSITARRWPSAEIVVCPAVMQGKDCPASVIAALNQLAGIPGVQAVAIARGGGSAEDLWAFNDESLAYAVYRFPLPVVSAIGHEVDYTIADFTADLRAPTPSSAAELMTPEGSEVLARVSGCREQMRTALIRQLDRRSQALEQLRGRPCFVSPEAPLRLREERQIRMTERLNATFSGLLDARTLGLHTLAARMEALDPLRVLQRGYAVVLRDGRALTDASDVKPGDSLHILLHRGVLDAEVKEETV